MKKLLHLKAILLTLCLSVVGGGSVCYADRVSTFTDKNLTVGEGELGWTSSHAAQQFESNGSSSYEPRGVQFGTSKAPINVFTLTANESLNGVTSVTIVASASGAGNTIAVKVGDTNFNGEVTEIASGTANANKEYTFTGEATNGVITITIDDKTKAVWVKSISVKNQDVVPGKEAAGLSFGEETKFTVDLSGTFTAPTLTKATDAAATYASSETSVATVDASTGDVTLVGAGTTTITATTPETDTYMAGSASYTLTITDVASMPKFQKVTTVTSGKRYLIVVENNGEISVAQPVPATGNPYGYLNVTAPAATDADGNIYMEDITNAFTLTAVEGGYYIQQSDGRYLYKSGSYDNFNVGNEAGDNAVWTIEPQADGTFLITNVSVNKYVQFDPNYNSFGSYANDRGTLPMLYEEVGGKTAPTVSFAQSEVTANLLSPDAFVAPELSSTSDGAVAYTSSNPDVATVDEDGLVSLVGQGTTTITATVAETDTYTEATAEYTLTVTTLSEFRKTATVTTGKQYILTADIDGTSHVAKTVREGNGYDYLYVNDLTTANVMASADLYSFTLTAVEGGFTIQQPDGRYLYMNDDDYTKLNAGEEAGANAVWSIAQQADGTFMIQNVATGKYIQYSTTHTSFGCYREAQDDGVRPSLYEKATLDVTDAGYATLFSQHAIIVPEGMEAAVATNVVDGRLAIDYRYPAGAVIPASTGVLLKAEAGNHGYNVATTDATAPADNLLKGSVEDATTVGDNCLFYMLSYDQNDENLGFYWGAENGAAFTNEGGKAYLAVPQATANGAIGFALDGSLVTAIGQATADTNAPAKIYTIDGRLMQQTRTADLPRGLYIVNGKKVIIK